MEGDIQAIIPPRRRSEDVAVNQVERETEDQRAHRQRGMARGRVSVEQRARVSFRRRQIAKYVLRGMNAPEIQEKLAVTDEITASISTIKNDIVYIRQNWAREAKAGADTHVAEQVARLKMMIQNIWRLVDPEDGTPDLEAVDRALKVLEREAKLLGLDGAIKMDLNVDGGDGQLERKLTQLIAASRAAEGGGESSGDGEK